MTPTGRPGRFDVGGGMPPVTVLVPVWTGWIGWTWTGSDAGGPTGRRDPGNTEPTRTGEVA